MEEVLEFISPEIIDILNAIGLPILTASIMVMYATLIKRTSFLQNSMTDMKAVYDTVIETARKRSNELEASIENQKKFNELYLQMVRDSNDHAEIIRQWKNSEIVIFKDKVDRLSQDLERANELLKQLEKENSELRDTVVRLGRQVSELEIRLMGPNESMVRNK